MRLLTRCCLVLRDMIFWRLIDILQDRHLDVIVFAE